MPNDARRAVRRSLARRRAAAAGQRTAQPIVATKPCEFNRPESPIRLPDENNRIIGIARVAMHIKMNRA
ncbi:hypothetical protein [Burkholderia cepacia]|uniref:hypothetical protein n=1 Tax=Burkholderia cepacia TaxID=292 RepID=UPI003D6743A4